MIQILLPFVLEIIKAFSVLFYIAVIVLCIVLLVAWSMLYEKMGLKGWMALVPFYSSYVLFKKVWKVKPFWIYLALSVVLVLLEILGVYFYNPGLKVLHRIMYLSVAIACLIVRFMLMSALSASFGHSSAYAFALLLLPIIFVPILAFGKAEYIGNQQNE